MASVYDQIQMKNGQTRYRMDKKFIGEDKVPENIKEVVTLANIVDENGMVIVEDKGDYGDMTVDEMATAEKAKAEGSDGDEPVETKAKDQSAPEADALPGQPPMSPDGDLNTPAALPSVPEAEAERVANLTPRLRSKVPQSDPGMGFKRVNGRTVDIFDSTSPHTHVKLVGGHTVPLSAESYKYRSDAEIEKRLQQLGYSLVDFNQLEEEQDNASGDDGLEDDDQV